MKYIVLTFLIKRDGKYYGAACKELGTVSFGESQEEAVANIIDATGVYLNALEDVGECDQVLAEKKVRIFDDEPAGLAMAGPPQSTIFSGVIPLDFACA